MKLTLSNGAVAVLGILFSLSAVACSAGEPAHPGDVHASEHESRSAASDEGTQKNPASSSGTPTPSNPSSPSAPSAPAGPTFKTATEQLAAGEQTFLSTCTRCHGNDGSGARGPRLIGRSDGALSSFANAEEVATFVAGNMPVASKGEAYAVVAYLMQKNGIEVGERVLDEAVAPTIEIH